jgi:hypothetical protein
MRGAADTGLAAGAYFVPSPKCDICTVRPDPRPFFRASDPGRSLKVTVFDTPPELALELASSFEGPVIVDLDETLYLQNSTEDFISCAVPGLLALLVLRACDVLKPWRLTGGEPTRDVWRVRLIALLFPWIWRRWHRQVAKLASLHTNTALCEVLKRRSKPTMIATIGFRSIVEPLIAAIGFADLPLIAVRGNGYSDRRAGKLALVKELAGDDFISQALVLTDSSDDAPLLAACRRGIRTLWPGARYRRALSQIYLPGQYLTLVKRPGERYILRGIIQEDFAFWILGTIALAPVWPLHLIGLSFLLLSFWIIYECGYVDNDRTGDRFEESPKLSGAFAQNCVATPRVEPWIWAAVTGALAIVILKFPGPPQLQDFLRWYTVLISTYVCFWFYNRIDKSSRVWLYVILQFARAAALVAVVPMMLSGTLAVAANALTRWLSYYVYRHGSDRWPDGHFHITRLMFLIILILSVALGDSRDLLHPWTTSSIVLWAVYRARKEISETFRQAKRIDKAKPRQE